MAEKLTRQGVRDLGGGRPPRRVVCRHFFSSNLVVIGHRPVVGWMGEIEDEPVYGQRCMHCGAVRP